MRLCPCGLEIDGTGMGNRIESRDSEGNLIYVVCPHGVVVVDKIGYDEEISDETP